MDKYNAGEEARAPSDGAEKTVSRVLYKFTNQKQSNHLDDILAMFYMGTMHNDLGIMTAFNLDTSEEELILVGVQLDEEGKADLYPLAKVLAVEDTRKYLAPDGVGGYYDPRDMAAVAEAKENMKSYNEAVQPEAETVQ